MDSDSSYLRIVLAPWDATKLISELGEDDIMVLAIQGPKKTLVAITEALATMNMDEEITSLLDP